ncbi:MAG: LuxR C-terminal-related transcriptional regulator [Actinomycetota bacterium]
MSLIGRHDAIGAVRAVLVAGHGTVAIVAPPGGGVSAFLDEAVVEATELGVPTLRAAGRAAESNVALGLLRELAARDDSGELARGLNDATDGQYEQALLDWAAGTQPLAVVVDDTHLADVVSGRALDYLARRTGNTSVVLVVGGHEATQLDALELAPMTVDELISVLAERFTDVDEAVARRVADLAEGSPLVAIEVTRTLDDAQRRGSAPLPQFPVTATPIRHAFDVAIRDLPDATRRALCVAAAEPTGELRVIAAAIDALGESLEALDEAEASDVISIADGTVRFDHPIRRSVAYHQLPPASRRGAHRALANALDAPQDAERRAAHLAVGVTVPDERIAADLELIAEAAERRRDFVEARRWWTAASQLTPDGHEAHRRAERANAAQGGDADPLAGLTKAERRVAAVVGAGATNKAAAETLYVSVKTVDAHLQSIYRKLAITSRAELAVLVTHADLAGAPAAG